MFIVLHIMFYRFKFKRIRMYVCMYVYMNVCMGQVSIMLNT